MLKAIDALSAVHQYICSLLPSVITGQIHDWSESREIAPAVSHERVVITQRYDPFSNVPAITLSVTKSLGTL